MMTGQYPGRNSIHRHFVIPKYHDNFSMLGWLDKHVITMSRTLKQASYKTEHFGKWHLTNRIIKYVLLPKEYGYDKTDVFNGPSP
jgi:N-acetylgalactosamine-6-sulfatase